MLGTETHDGGNGQHPGARLVDAALEPVVVVAGVENREAYVELLATRPGAALVSSSDLPSSAPEPAAPADPGVLERLEEAIEAHRVALAAAEAAAMRLGEARNAGKHAARRLRDAEEAIREGTARLVALEVATLSEAEVRRRVERAREQLGEADARAAQARASLAEVKRAALTALAVVAARIEDLETVRGRLHAESTESLDLGPVERALQELDARTRGPVSPAATALAGELEEADDLVGALEATRPAPASDRMLAIAQEQLDLAQRAYDDARASLHTVSDEDRRAIDALHLAVEEASTAVRLDAKGATGKLATARRAERAALERLGFTSYSEYLLAVGTGDPAGKLRIWSAEKDLRAAREDLERVCRTREVDPRLAEARQARDVLRDRARTMLGCDPGHRAAELLRAHPDVDGHLVESLARALAAAGVHVVARPIDEAARELLATHGEAAARARERREELERIERELASCREEADRLRQAAEDDTAQAQRLADEYEEQRAEAAASVDALEEALEKRLEETPDAIAAAAARDQLQQRIERLRAVLDDLKANAGRDLEAVEQDYDAHASRLAEARRQLAERLDDVEPGGSRRDATTVLARARRRRRFGLPAPALPDLGAAVERVAELIEGPNSPSTIVLDLPMTGEDRVSDEHAERLVGLARHVRIVWVTA
jgi:hypothetical protein